MHAMRPMQGWMKGSAAMALVAAALLCHAQPVQAQSDHPVAPASFPVLAKITPSFSVAPREYLRRRGPRGARINHSPLTVWLSANVHDLLPPVAAKAWPSPLRLSVGRRAFGGTTPSEYVIGLDLDAARLPGNHPAWVQVKKLLHTVRLPGPALVMSGNGTKAFGLYW